MAAKPGFSLSSIPRCRWNVLDLVTIVGREAVRAYMFFDVDMTWAQQMRAKLEHQGEHVTFSAILLKAIAIAQRAHPISRQAYLPFNLRLNLHQITAGLTVEKYIGDEPAVFFGVIEHPDRKSLGQITTELKGYASRGIEDVERLKLEHNFSKLPRLVRRAVIRLGLLIPPLRMQVNSATFGFSSLGKYGVAAALGPCVCACTFGIGSVEDRVVVRDGNVVVRPIMTMALSYDQRVMDAAPAASFMSDVKVLLEGGLEQYVTPAQPGEMSVHAPKRIAASASDEKLVPA